MQLQWILAPPHRTAQGTYVPVLRRILAGGAHYYHKIIANRWDLNL